MSSSDFDYIIIFSSVVIAIFIGVYSIKNRTYKHQRIIFLATVILSFGLVFPYISQRMWIAENYNDTAPQYLDILKGLDTLYSWTKFPKYWLFGSFVLAIPLIAARFKS